MSRGKRVSDTEREVVVRAWKNGATVKEAGAAAGRSEHSARRIIDAYTSGEWTLPDTEEDDIRRQAEELADLIAEEEDNEEAEDLEETEEAEEAEEVREYLIWIDRILDTIPEGTEPDQVKIVADGCAKLLTAEIEKEFLG